MSRAPRSTPRRPRRNCDGATSRKAGLPPGQVAAKSVSEIAERLHLSVKTVSTYRTRILEKLSLSSNAEIIQYAVRSGLVR